MDRSKSYTAAILKKYGYKSVETLTPAIEELPVVLFRNRGINKELFSISVKKLIKVIEHEGGVVSDARAMSAPGALFESMNSSYLQMRYAYLQKRKELSEKLEIISRIRQEFYHLRQRENWNGSSSGVLPRN